MVAVFQTWFCFPEEAVSEKKKKQAEEHRFEKCELSFKKKK